MSSTTVPFDVFSSGSWTLYFHDPEDSSWRPDSYKKIGTFSKFQDFWGAMKAIPTERFLAGMFFLMKDPFLPLWEHKSNIYGGTYCIKVVESTAHEIFQRYSAAAVIDMVSKEKENTIVGVSISPKKGFHILKLWNMSSKYFNKPSEINLYGEGMKPTDVLYRPHVDQKM
jgi:hypothetical protein